MDSFEEAIQSGVGRSPVGDISRAGRRSHHKVKLGYAVQFAAITMSIGLLILSGIMAMIAKSIVNGELPPNAEVGFRTKATKSSPEAWHAGHKAIVPLLRVIWPLGVGLALITVVGGFIASDDWVVAALGGMAYTVVIALLIVAVRKANRAARTVQTAQ